MSERIKEVPEAKSAEDVIPAQPGEQPPIPRITEEERAHLNEAWQEMRAEHNAQVAMLTEARRLDAERRVAEAEAKVHVLVGQQLEAAVQQRLQALRTKYNVPEGYQIDAKTGVVSPPSTDEQAAAPSTPAAADVISSPSR